MAGKVISGSFPSGIPGTVSRSGDNVIDSYAVYDASNTIEPGTPVVLGLTGLTVQAFTSSNDAEDLIGFAVRDSRADDPYGSGAIKFSNNQMIDVLKRGCMTVHLGAGTPLRGGSVYYNYVNKSICAAAVTSQTVQLTNCKFNGPRDSNNNVEIVVLTRQL